MANKFTWFPKLTASLKCVPDGPRGELCWAIIQYGTDGIEPEFTDWALSAIFESLREDIDNSIAARNKNKGGRPPKSGKPEAGASSEQETPENPETGVSENKNGGFGVSESDETGVSESENGGFDVSENPETPPYIPNHTSPDQTIDSPIQGRADAMRAAPEGFEPPTLEECRAHFATNCLKGDPDTFWAHYESQGWVKSNGQPVDSLSASALLWSKRQVERDAEAHARGKPTDAEIQAATFKPAVQLSAGERLRLAEEEAAKWGM